MKVLIIDSNPHDRLRMRQIIQQTDAQAQIAEADSAAELDRQLGDNAITLVLTEHTLSALAGPSLVQAIRERRPDLPVVLVTAVLDEAIGQAALQAGARDVVLKQQLYRLPLVLRAAQLSGGEQTALAVAQQHSEEQFRALVEDAPIGITIARAGSTISANRAYLRMFGYATAAEVVGASLLRDIAPHAREQMAERVRQREQGLPVPNAYETVGLRTDGSQFPFHVEVARVTFAEGPVTVAFFTDITARKHAQDRLRFLTEASALLATSLDYETTLAQVAQMVVPEVADWCDVDMLSADGALEHLAVANADPQKTALGRTGHLRYPPDQTQLQAHPALRVLQTGQAELIADIPDALLQALAHDADHLALLRSLGFRSALYVPLIVRERVVGSIALIMAESGRRYSAADIPFAEELARRAALAIESARLYRSAYTQREQLHITLSSIGDGVIATDTSGSVTLLNRVAEALTGWTEADALGRPLDDIFVIINEQTRAAIESPMTKVLREGAVVGLANHTVLVAKDGHEIPIDNSGAPIRAADGQLLGVVLVFHDITGRRQAEATLREQEALFRTMADSAPVLIWVSDTEKRCTFFNQAWLNFTGRTMEQEVGFGWIEGVHPDDYDYCLSIYTSSFDARQPFSMDYRFRRADGVYRWLVDSAVPHWTPEGDFVGYIGSCIDITARKDTEERQRFLAEASPVLAGSLDYAATLVQVAQLFVPRIADYTLLYVAESDGRYRQVAAAHRYADKQAIVDALAQVYRPGDLGNSPILSVLRTGQSVLESNASVAAAASILTDPIVLDLYAQLNQVSYMIVPLIARSQVVGAITLSTAESGRRYTAEDLEFVSDLANRCALALDNARLYADARQAIALRDQFVSIASHELKTPLTSMLGYTRLLQRRNEREHLLNERDTRALDTIAKQGARLDRLVNLLLDLSRIETGQLQLDPVPLDLRGLVQRLVDEIQPTLEQHIVELAGIAEPLVVLGDEGRLEQVIQNLVSNATKYSPSGGTVTIQLEQHDAEAAVAVRDQGIGIPANALPRLGERFFRAANVNPQNISGTGIGLYVAKEIIQLHGGTLTVESTEGRGTTVTVRLPIYDGKDES